MKSLITKPLFFYKLRQERYKQEENKQEDKPSYLGQIYKNVKIRISRSFTRSSTSSQVRRNMFHFLKYLMSSVCPGNIFCMVPIIHISVLQRFTPFEKKYYKTRSIRCKPSLQWFVGGFEKYSVSPFWCSFIIQMHYISCRRWVGIFFCLIPKINPYGPILSKNVQFISVLQ